MSSTALDAAPTLARPAATRAHGTLALLFQEPFTVAIRVRARRQAAADAESFRVHVKQLLAAADREARQAGYGPDTVRLAVYAYVAFLDESVLNSSQAMFASWPRQPLQEEVFGEHMAGETFFRYLDDLLAQQDSDELADVLEVYVLCLLLGFRGRYGASAPGGVDALVTAARQKIWRIRGAPGALAPAAALPADEEVVVERDRWLRRLGMIALATLATAALLYVVFRLGLGSDVAELRSLTDGLLR